MPLCRGDQQSGDWDLQGSRKSHQVVDVHPARRVLHLRHGGRKDGPARRHAHGQLLLRQPSGLSHGLDVGCHRLPDVIFP